MWQVTALFSRWALDHPSRRNELEDKGCFHWAQAALGKHRQPGAQRGAGSPTHARGKAANRMGGAQASWGSSGVWHGPPLPALGLFQSYLKQGQGRVQIGKEEILGKLNRMLKIKSKHPQD